MKPTNLEGTVWENVDETKILLDKDEIEANFMARAPVVREESKNEKKEPQKISYLSPDRVKNIELILGRLKMSFSLIAQSVLECNMKVLHLDTIECLINAAPQDSELSLYQGSDDIDKNTLQAPDLFFLEISVIPQYQNRLIALKTTITNEEIYTDLMKKLKKIQAGLKFQRKDDSFFNLLQYGLAFGNYLNGQSSKGGAYGFKIDSLKKFIDVRAIDGKRNLLLFIINKAESDLKKELYTEEVQGQIDFEFLSKMPIQQLTIDLGEMKKLHRSVEKAISSQIKDHPYDHVEEKLSPLSSKMVDQISYIETLIKECQEDYEGLCKYYGENPKTLTSDKLFELVKDVWDDYQKCKTLDEKIRLQEKKEEERRQLQERKRMSLGSKPDDFDYGKSRQSMRPNATKNDVLHELRAKQNQKIMMKAETTIK